MNKHVFYNHCINSYINCIAIIQSFIQLVALKEGQWALFNTCQPLTRYYITNDQNIPEKLKFIIASIFLNSPMSTYKHLPLTLCHL